MYLVCKAPSEAPSCSTKHIVKPGRCRRNAAGMSRIKHVWGLKYSAPRMGLWHKNTSSFEAQLKATKQTSFSPRNHKMQLKSNKDLKEYFGVHTKSFRVQIFHYLLGWACHWRQRFCNSISCHLQHELAVKQTSNSKRRNCFLTLKIWLWPMFQC